MCISKMFQIYFQLYLHHWNKYIAYNKIIPEFDLCWMCRFWDANLGENCTWCLYLLLKISNCKSYCFVFHTLHGGMSDERHTLKFCIKYRVINALLVLLFIELSLSILLTWAKGALFKSKFFIFILFELVYLTTLPICKEICF